MAGLHPLPEPSAGDWIEPRLGGAFGAVSRTVPRGYAAHARVLHPVDPTPLPEPTTWAGVCARTGRIPHALMQWEAITSPALSGVQLPATRDGRWAEVEVRRGTLQPATLRRLLDVLVPFTGEQDCYHALWHGYGWLTGGSTFLTSYSGPPPQPSGPTRAPRPPALEQALGAPRLSLPGRDYFLFTGRLHAALEMGDQITDDWFEAQSPNLLWPADRSWCLASEIDVDSTLLGGPAELIDAVLAAPGLEAWAVHEDDDLSPFADHLNT